MMNPKKSMGLEVSGDQKVPVRARDWDAMKRAVWRSRTGFEIIEREIAVILDRCAHLDGCPGASDETAPCLGGLRMWNGRNVDGSNDNGGEIGCPDREIRASALVVLNVARQHMPVTARRPADAPYFAPSREYFSEVLAELAATQIELARLQSPISDAHTEPTLPPAAP